MIIDDIPTLYVTITEMGIVSWSNDPNPIAPCSCVEGFLYKFYCDEKETCWGMIKNLHLVLINANSSLAVDLSIALYSNHGASILNYLAGVREFGLIRVTVAKNNKNYIVTTVTNNNLPLYKRLKIPIFNRKNLQPHIMTAIDRLFSDVCANIVNYIEMCELRGKHMPESSQSEELCSTFQGGAGI